MKKEELSKLRSLYATQSMVRALQMRGRENIDKYRYHLAAMGTATGALLKVSVCVREDIEKGVMTPKWDIFINYQGMNILPGRGRRMEHINGGQQCAGTWRNITGGETMKNTAI